MTYMFGIQSVRGGLNWEQKTIELNADATSEYLTVHFALKNDGAMPVDVGKVEGSCGCITETLQQRHFETGQSGEITARYQPGNYSGLQRLTIAVTTSDRPDPTILSLIVHIPEVVHIQPALVSWQRGEKIAPKFINLNVLQNAPIVTMTVQSLNSGMTVKMEPNHEGGKYQIAAEPSKTDVNLFTTLTIRCRFGQKEKIYHAYATVQ